MKLNADEQRIVTAVGGGWLQQYVRVKLKTDPVYRAALEIFRSRDVPLLDLGAGIGLLPYFLQAHGVRQPVLCIEQDRRKVEIGRRLASALSAAQVSYSAQDVRLPLKFSGDVALIDVLHYLSVAEQRALLHRVASYASASGSLVVIRDCLRDDSWRFRATLAQETFSKAIRWLKSDRFEFPRLESIVGEMESNGMTQLEVRPLWGGTPFNNYLLTFGRR